MRPISKILIIVFIIFMSNIAYGAIIYVDGGLTGDCTSKNYSIANRDCSGSDGSAYITIANAVSAASVGDSINIRAGIYTENNISIGFSGPSMTTIQAYNSESVTINNSAIHLPTISLGIAADDITFKDLRFASLRWIEITGWTNESGDIWYQPHFNEPNKVMFQDSGYGQEVISKDALDTDNEWWWDSVNNRVYVYAESDPDNYYSGTNYAIAEGNGFNHFAIGNTSSNTGFIVVDNCEIESFSHCGFKGGYKWWIKNSYIHDIGVTSQDHGIYLYGEHSSENEAILEYNYFKDITGSAVDIYLGGSTPSYHIIRYNLVNNADRSGIQLQGAYNQVYNNSFYGGYIGIMFRGTASHSNVVRNNIFDGNYWCDIQIDYQGSQLQFPTNNTLTNNFLGSAASVHGYCNGCSDRTSIGGPDYSSYIGNNTIMSSNNPFTSDSPSEWTDFILSVDSDCIDTGANLDPYIGFALDQCDDKWPPSTLEQDLYGSGWEIGAFVFNPAPCPPKNFEQVQ